MSAYLQRLSCTETRGLFSYIANCVIAAQNGAFEQSLMKLLFFKHDILFFKVRDVGDEK
jgi:hypothetical protein